MGGASELQVSLVALAALFVLLVWVYNRWQEYRQRRAARKIFGEKRADPLGAEIAGARAEETQDGRRIEPVMGEAVQAANEDTPPAPPLDLADPAIDCLIALHPRDELAAPVFWEAQRQQFDDFADSLRWLAWHQGQWRRLNPHDAGACSAFMAALQLADRSGPLGEEALAGLTAAAERLAEAIGAELDAPAADEVLAQAAQLDQFCAGVDWRIGMNLVAGSAPLKPDSVQAGLVAGGLEPWGEGLMHAADGAGQTQFVVSALGGGPLVAAEALSGLSLSIDVPLVVDGVAAFDRLLELARSLAQEQGMVLVDEQRQPLAESALAAIRAKIAEFQEKMRAADIPAGGRRALRLYA